VKIAPEGYPFIIVSFVALIVTFLAAIWVRHSGMSVLVNFLPLAAVVFLVISSFMLFFFRDPDRAIPSGTGIFVSAADGEVLSVREEYEKDFLHAKVKKISVFMSPLDVHVNRAPCAGKVVDVRYTPGRFFKAFTEEASLQNENIAMVVEGEQGRVLVKQIAGIIARRAVCRVKPGDMLARGDRYGIIKFSSRCELSLPPEAEVSVKPGDKVRGGETVVAVMRNL
jgi:phosphatidylserine decarboxylase